MLNFTILFENNNCSNIIKKSNNIFEVLIYMKFKKIIITFVSLLLITAFAVTTSAATVYTVQSGDTMWKIASKYQTGISEIKAANPQITNINMIYPGQKLTIPAASSFAAMEDEVIRLVNVERAKQGLPALKKNWEVARVARYKASDMATNHYFSHTSPKYGSPFNMMEDFNIRFSAAGENIAMGQKTAAAVMQAWMNSPGHRSNILSRNYTQIGVGAAKNSSGTLYWSQLFIKPAS